MQQGATSAGVWRRPRCSGSLRDFPSWASRPAQLDGAREEARNWPFNTFLDQIYRVWSTYMYYTCICIVAIIFFSKLLCVHLYTHVHVLCPPMAVAEGAFLSLTLLAMTTLVEKMAFNQGWSEEHVQTLKRGGGIHQLKEVDMLSAKMDLLMKKLKDRANEKQEVMHIHDSRMTCEVCGNTRHSGN